jgi:serine phosphatase RsbU (regulator of sigma subunit)
MERVLLALARRFLPDALEKRGRDRAVNLSSLLVALYAGPLALVTLVWLVAVTDLAIFAAHWLPLLIIFALIYALRRFDFTSYYELEPGLFGSFGGAFDDICRWPAALLFGPTALWLFIVWRVVEFVRDLRRSDVTELRWTVVRGILMDLGGSVLAALVGLELYTRLGGDFPPAGLSVRALMPAVSATLVRYLGPVVISSPYLAYIARSPALAFDAESRRRVFRFSLLASGWPLVMAPFAVFAAGVYVELGVVAFLFVAGGALLAGLLAHRMSRAVEVSRGRTRELESLDRLSRAVLSGPPDASQLAEQLSEHVSTMFVLCTMDIRLFPDRTLLHTPDYAEPPDEVVWEWIQATGETYASPAGRELPWGDVPRSYGLVLVPIINTDSGAVIGGIVLRKRVNPERVDDVLPAAQSLAAQIASALHGAQVYRQTLEHMRVEEELAVAADMQASLMPTVAPNVPGWEFKALIDSAREASGDFIDLIPLSGDRWGILVADVAGKGVAAALYMAVVRTLIRTYAAENEERPEQVMRQVNRRILADTSNESFVTAFYAVLDPSSGRLKYCNAGHNPPFLFRASDGGKVVELSGTGIPLGMLEEADWESTEVTLGPGDRLLAYTDGVTDARNEEEESFGERRLLEVAKANVGGTPLEMRTAVFDEVKQFVGNAPQVDDITLMVMARQPGPPLN